MHEAIITRREAMGTDALLPIMVRENCVLVHQRCHAYAGARPFQKLAIGHLLDEEGKDAIIEWLESLRPHFKTGLVDEKIRLVESCYAEKAG